MRLIITKILSLFAATLLLGACHPEGIIVYIIDVDSKVACTTSEQDLTIKIGLNEELLMADEMPIVVSNADWVTVSETTLQSVVLHVLENTGDKRSATITITANGHKQANIKLLQYGTPPEEVNHTLMYLFLGTNLNSYFNANLKDASTAIETGALGDYNRVLFVKQSSRTKCYIGELCYNTEGGECIEQRLEEFEIPDGNVTPELVSSYIAAMAEYAPAKRYGLVCAGHGQAWLPRDVVLSDTDITKFGARRQPWRQAEGAEVTRAYGESDAMLNITELADAIEESNVELDYILFDACFMSNIETVYDLRNAANYIIASPCEIMGKGFPYERTLPHLFSDNGNTTDYAGAAESYYIYYRDEYVQTARSGSIAVFDCSEIEALAESTKRVVASATESYDKSSLQTYEGEQIHHFFDFGQWVNVVATDKTALDTFNTQLSKTVIAKYSLSSFYSAYGSYGTYPINLNVYSGVTTSAPSEAFPNAWHETNWYKDVWTVNEN